MTKIINAHVHMIEIEALVERMGEPFLPGGIPVYEHIEASLAMLKPETLIAQMDEAGIDMSVLYAVAAPILYASNDYVRKLVDQFPDRLMGFASVSPLSPGAADELERAVQDLGLRGLKLHPPLQGFFPNDESVFPLYEKAVALNIPVVFHVGTTPFGNRCSLRAADPLLIDDVACAFPSLRIMLTHLGTLWHNEAFMVVEKHPNVFIDTAAYVYEIPRILDKNLVKRIGRDKIVFGTDYPSPFADEPHRMKDFVDVVGGLELEGAVLEGIFHSNFSRLLEGGGESKPLDPFALLAALGSQKGDT